MAVVPHQTDSLDAAGCVSIEYVASLSQLLCSTHGVSHEDNRTCPYGVTLLNQSSTHLWCKRTVHGSARYSE